MSENSRQNWKQKSWQPPQPMQQLLLLHPAWKEPRETQVTSLPHWKVVFYQAILTLLQEK